MNDLQIDNLSNDIFKLFYQSGFRTNTLKQKKLKNDVSQLIKSRINVSKKEQKKKLTKKVKKDMLRKGYYSDNYDDE